MTTLSLIWRPEQDTVAGSISATLALDRAAWEAMGASFAEIDDEGEQAGLAVGTVELDDAPVEFGVLDHEEETTHLIVGGPYGERAALSARLVEELTRAGVITDEDQVLEIIGLVEPASVEDKLDYLSGVMTTLVTDATRGLEAQLRQTREQLAEVMRRTASELPAIEPPLALPDLGIGDLRYLLSVPGTARIEKTETSVHVHGTLPGLRRLTELMSVWQQVNPPAAQLERFDPIVGEAVITILADDARIPLIIVGLPRIPNPTGEAETWLSFTMPARPDLSYSEHEGVQQSFEFKAHPQRQPRLRTVHLRIFGK